MDSETMTAYAEIDYILSKMPKSYREKVPIKLREKFRTEKNINYEVLITKNKHLKEQNLQRKTLSILAILKYNYWCKSEEEKQTLENMFNENERKYQEEIQKKYNYDDIFKKQHSKDIIQEPEKENKSLIKYQKTWYRKILDFISKIFYWRKDDNI